MHCITFFTLLPLAACMCTDREACMDASDVVGIDAPISAQALLQVRKKEAQVILQDEQLPNKGDDFYSFITKIVEMRHQGATEGIGSTEPLDEEGYQKVKAECCNLEMMFFVRRVIDEVLGLEVCNEGGLSGFVPWFTCETNAQKSYHDMVAELKRSVPPINCAFLAAKGTCKSLDFSQCHGVENKEQYKECEDDVTVKTTTPRPIPLDCTPLNKGEVCVGNGPHEDMGSITTLCACDCLQCESLKGRRCLLKDCIDLNLVESTKCTPTWPGQAGTCLADQHDNGTSFCIVPVPKGCSPVTLHTTSTTTTGTLDCSPLNSGEVCVGSGPGKSAKTTLCTCDCELCEAKLKLLGEHRPCITSDCLDLHLTNSDACTPKWPGDNGICEADLESNTSSLCKVPLPPGCLVPTPPPGTTTTTSPATCDPLNVGQVCTKAGPTSTALCECDCIACSVKKGDYCTADDCLNLGFFDVSKCNPPWPGADGACDLVAAGHCKIPVPAGCPPAVIPPPGSTTSTAPVATTKTATTAQFTTTEALLSTTPETTTTTKPTTTEPTTVTTTTSLDCAPIDGNKGYVVYNSEDLCACDCIKCRHHLHAPGIAPPSDSPAAESRLYSPVFDCDFATCKDMWTINFSLCANFTGQKEDAPYCKIDMPEGCPQPPHENVNCGDHDAVSCPECGTEAGQCNGDCVWVLGTSDNGGTCIPTGTYADHKLDCGNGQLTDSCELCSEDVCKASEYTEGHCVMGWQESTEGGVAQMTEKCVSFSITAKCDGLDPERWAYSDCSGCEGGGLYGSWKPHAMLGYIWNNNPGPVDADTKLCYEKATTPNPCAPLDPTDTGHFCDAQGNRGYCKCDCKRCLQFKGETCTWEECQTYTKDTGYDWNTCVRSEGWQATFCESEAFSNGRCAIALPDGCPQLTFTVNCGTFRAAGCSQCKTTNGNISDCGGDCFQLRKGSTDSCWPRGWDVNVETVLCGDGTRATECRYCPIDTCQADNNGDCLVSADESVCENAAV